MSLIMAAQTNPLRITSTLTYITFILALALISSRGQPNKAVMGDHGPKYRSTEKAGVIARDVITLTVGEVRNARKFINSIPRLKSMGDRDTPELVTCVVGLISNLSDIRSTLKRLRHLKSPSICSDSKSLKTMMAPIVTLDNACHLAMDEVDSIISLMLKQKLIEIALMVDDVAYRVSQLKKDEPCDGSS